MQASFDSAGADHFVASLLEECSDRRHTREREEWHIERLQPALNGTTTEHSKLRRRQAARERRQRISKKPEPFSIGKKVWPSYEVYLLRKTCLEQMAASVRERQ